MYNKSLAMLPYFRGEKPIVRKVAIWETKTMFPVKKKKAALFFLFPYWKYGNKKKSSSILKIFMFCTVVCEKQ